MKRLTMFLFLFMLLLGKLCCQEFPQLDTFTLRNGLKVYLLRSGSDSVLDLRLVMSGGKRNETSCQVGYSEIIQKLFEETLKEKQGTVQKKKSRLNCEVIEGQTRFHVVCSKRELAKKMEVLGTALLRLPFKKVKMDKTVYEIVDSYKPENISPQRVSEVFRDLFLYGAKDPLGRNYCQYQSEKVTPEELREFYYRYYSPKHSALVICGDLDTEEVKKLVTRQLGKWRNMRKHEKTKDDELKAPGIRSKQVAFINKRNSTYCLLKWIQAAPAPTSPDHPAFLLTCSLFQRYLLAQVNENSSDTLKFTPFSYRTHFRQIDCRVAHGQLNAAIRLFEHVLQNFHHRAFTQTEVNEAISQLQEQQLKNTGAKAISAFYDPLVYDLESRKNYSAALSAIKPADIQRIVESFFDPEACKLIIVGKETEVEEQLALHKELTKHLASGFETCDERCVPIKKRWKPHDEQPRLFCRECWRLGRFWGKNKAKSVGLNLRQSGRPLDGYADNADLRG